MSEVKIITNNHVRELRYLYELSESEQNTVKKDFDWIDDSSTASWDDELFINYRNSWYCLSDFMSLHNKVYNPNPPDFMQGFDGYLSDSFFSGILIKLFDDNLCTLAWFYS